MTAGRNHLLPLNSTQFERAISETIDRMPEIEPSIADLHAFKYRGPNDSILPWLIHEYGLGGISQFFAEASDTIAEGIPWSRMRGTPLAIGLALGWIGYEAISLEDQNAHRRMWHRYQTGMGEIPDADLPRLADAEYLAGLSDPARSVFFRGWAGYDVRALEWSGGRWSGALWGDDSGVRLDGGSVKWSHGEYLADELTATGAQRAALGLDFALGDPVGWINIPWNAPGVSWDGVSDIRALKSFLLSRMPIHVGFYDGEGNPIGYRRVLARSDVTDDVDPGDGMAALEVECRTGFGDGEGNACASVSLVFNGRNMDPAKPGKLWLGPGEIAFPESVDEADMTIGPIAADFLFRRTVRQRVLIQLVI